MYACIYVETSRLLPQEECCKRVDPSIRSENCFFNNIKYTYLSAILNALELLGSAGADITGALTGAGCV